MLAFASLLGGCAVGPDYRPPAPAALGVPDAYSIASPTASPPDLSVWWRQFGDPLLTDLIGRATAGNLDIVVAQTRLRQAREALIQTRSTLFPSIGGSAGVSHNVTYAPEGTVVIGGGNSGTGGAIVTTGGNSAINQFSLGLNASWQADVFGGTRRSIEAARADADVALFNLAGVRTSVAGEVATNYVSARLAQARLAIARDTLRTQDDNLQIAGWRVQAGLVSSVDAEQARAQRAQTAASIPLLETSFTNAVNRIGVLTGQAPGALRTALQVDGPIPHGPDRIAVGIPADTLRQRPDVRAAERNLASATAQIGVARAQLFPALAITGTINTAAARVGSLTDIITGALFAGLTQTIFDAGRLRSQVRSARAGADNAFATYKQTVLGGLEEVENAIQAIESAQARQAELTTAVDASNNAAILARSQYRVGLTDFLRLLQSEQSLLSARDQLASAQADQALALIRLYLALGGGWLPDTPEMIGPLQ
nr:Outer membrane efflux protein [uncultured organism]